MEPKDRIKQIYQELEMSQRGFATSIGLQPTSLAAILSGRSGVTQVLANSIELFSGYSAKWILNGEGEALAEKTNQTQLYESMLAYAVEGIFSEDRLGAFVEKGLMMWVDKEIDEKRDKYIKRIKKTELSEQKIFSEIGMKIEDQIKIRDKRDALIEEASMKLDENEFTLFLFKIYLEVIKKQLIEIDTADFNVTPKDFKKKVAKRANSTIKQIKKMYLIWEEPK